MGRIRSHMPRRTIWAPAAVLLAVAAGLLLGPNVRPGTTRIAYTPMIVPVYTIEAVSNGRIVTLPGLPIKPVGVPQVKTPVDINGDLLPDVEVGVNLLNVEGLFQLPPKIGSIVAPNIEINRLVTASAPHAGEQLTPYQRQDDGYRSDRRRRSDHAPLRL